MGDREPVKDKERERLTDLLADFIIDSYFNENEKEKKKNERSKFKEDGKTVRDINSNR